MTTMHNRLPHKSAEVAAALAKSTKGLSRKSRAVIRDLNAAYGGSNKRKLAMAVKRAGK
jgi:hypothetical protein